LVLHAMSDANDLALLRATTVLDSDAATAAALASAVLGSDPANEAAGLLLAAACRRLGDAQRAIELLRGLIAKNPGAAILELELGRQLAAGGLKTDAIRAMRNALSLDGRLAQGWLELAGLLLEAGEESAADEAYLRYRQLVRNPTDLADAYAAFDAGRLDDALLLTQRRLQAGTDEAAAFTLLAAVAVRRADDFAEEGSLLELLRLAPCDNSARSQLAELYLRTDRPGPALLLIDRLLRSQPTKKEYGLLAVEASRQIGDIPRAGAVLDELINRFPDDANLWLVQANMERFAGDQMKAIDSIGHALKLQPGYGAAYAALADLKTYRFSASELESMQHWQRTHELEGIRDADLDFALGQAFEDCGEYSASFEHYAAGNRVARAQFEYQAKLTTDFVERSRRLFTPEFFAARSGGGSNAQDPIFVVGMPRSGSTLVEQILASHSSIEGTRELTVMPMLARSLSRLPGNASYPEILRSIPVEELERLARRYIDAAQLARPLHRAFFVDKMYANFNHVGLIHLLFPHARVIDVRRHPLATGFACFKQRFRAGMNFAYDLNELGLFYRDYIALMDHWDAVLPGRVYRVRYEALVENTEAEVRALLAHCGLEFESACLRYYENDRVAQTLSSEQVKRPIYREGLDHWRHYEGWLGPFRQALEQRSVQA
jgi:predicted Zn-dependent protease